MTNYKIVAGLLPSMFTLLYFIQLPIISVITSLLSLLFFFTLLMLEPNTSMCFLIVLLLFQLFRFSLFFVSPYRILQVIEPYLPKNTHLFVNKYIFLAYGNLFGFLLLCVYTIFCAFLIFGLRLSLVQQTLFALDSSIYYSYLIFYFLFVFCGKSLDSFCVFVYKFSSGPFDDIPFPELPEPEAPQDTDKLPPNPSYRPKPKIYTNLSPQIPWRIRFLRNLNLICNVAGTCIVVTSMYFQIKGTNASYYNTETVDRNTETSKQSNELSEKKLHAKIKANYLEEKRLLFDEYKSNLITANEYHARVKAIDLQYQQENLTKHVDLSKDQYSRKN